MGIFSPDENGWVKEEELTEVNELLRDVVRSLGFEKTKVALNKSSTLTLRKKKLFNRILNDK